jgi:hypothetical protein
VVLEILGAAFYSGFAEVLVGVLVVKSDFTGDKDFVSMCFFVGDLFSSRD